MYFECDCSEEPGFYFEGWQEGLSIAVFAKECCECGCTIAPDQRYWWGSGINPEECDVPVYDDGGDVNDEAEKFREDYVRCMGCHAIAQHLARFGSILGGLAEQVERCTGFDYRDDPETWDSAEVDAEDAKHRAEIGGAA